MMDPDDSELALSREELTKRQRLFRIIDRWAMTIDSRPAELVLALKEAGFPITIAIPLPRAQLGLATTRELLEEVAARMEITQNSTSGRALGRQCREAVAKLDSGVLDYRVTDK